MSKVQFKINHSGISELLKSDAVKNLVSQAGEHYAAMAGEGFRSVNKVEKRTVSYVEPGDPKSYYKNKKEGIIESLL